MLLNGTVGELVSTDGASPPSGIRQGRQGDLIASELHGRFYEQNFRGRLYSGGIPLTAVNAATNTTATLGPTAVPILGLWNPSSSTVNLVVLQAMMTVALTALQNTGLGALLWCTSVGNSNLTLGNAPLNRKTLLNAGSLAKDMSGIALTGLTNNLIVRNVSPLGSGNLYNIASLGTAAGWSTTSAPEVENVDGAWIIPPGGVIALLAATTPVAHSIASGITWEEVPV